MSQVSDILDELSDRVTDDKIPTIYTAINRAIRILSKRLYLLDSDLITGVLSIPVYEQASYTASTIAFVSGLDGEPDTITDSAAQFLIEGFLPGMGVYSDCDCNQDARYVSSVTVDTLTLRAGEKVYPQLAGAEYVLQSENDYGYLPDDFWGFIGKPYIVGQKTPLTPLPDQHTLLRYMGTSGLTIGTPLHYKLISDKIGLIPATAETIIVSGFYYKKPVRVTGMDDYLPFGELLDDVIVDYLLATFGEGAIGVVKAAAILENGVDLVCLKRGQAAPVRFPQGTDYDSLKI
jgi:hypothetical protein